jgi:hypothetical protein
MKKIILVFSLVVLSALLLVGCGNKTTVYSDGDTTVTATDEGDGTVSGVMTDDESGTTTYQGGENLQLPDIWPENTMPVYPGSEIVYVIANQGGSDGSENAIIAVGCDADLDEVASFYQEQLADAANFSTTQMEGYYMIGGEKDGAGFSIIITSEQNSDWSGSQVYPTYAMITYYTL